MDWVDSHIHWFPDSFYEFFAKRSAAPRAERTDRGWLYVNGNRTSDLGREWFDLDRQWETLAATGRDMSVITSMGVHSDLDGLPAAEAQEAARIINEEWAAMQRRYPGRFFAAAGVPLQDTTMAIEELDHAIRALDLRAVSIPGSVNGEGLDSPRLEPFWAHVEQLGIPMFLHPTDAVFRDVMDGYSGDIYWSLGRMVDSSTGVLRLILSGVLDRHPALNIIHFHCGGLLPYASGRIDKNIDASALEAKPSEYIKRFWVDTAMPHSLTIEMAIKYYGIDHVVYGSDLPCWEPAAAMSSCAELDLNDDERIRLFDANIHGLVDLRSPVLR